MVMVGVALVLYGLIKFVSWTFIKSGSKTTKTGCDDLWGVDDFFIQTLVVLICSTCAITVVFKELFFLDVLFCI